MPLDEDNIELAEASQFDPAKPLATMEDVRSRMGAGMVVYRHQFAAFIEELDRLRTWLEKLEKHKAYLGAWAMTHKVSIQRYEKERAARRRKYYADLAGE